ncbi:MAG: FAD-dependent monooxygenase [Candidatus Promineifilaceae bacterium]|jgi:geranylgeranyl reductase family protein
MEAVEHVDVLIVGSGPAGASTALHLVRQDPEWAWKIAVIDKAIHPREKLCGGGVTHLGQRILARLGLAFEPDHFSVREARINFQDLSFSFWGNPIIRIVRRDEFDHWLVRKAEEWGVAVRQGEPLKNIEVHPDYVEVITDRAVIRAKVVVAADGSRSTVRQKLKWDDESRVARLLEVLTPEDPRMSEEFQHAAAVFDFSATARGMQGYYWDFPSRIKGKAFMNRGVFDSRAQPAKPKADLVQELSDSMAARNRDLENYQLKGHPIRWFDKDGRFSISRVILAGDAAGTDPLVGEGISFALAYGDVAAQAIAAAFENDDFTFSDYKERILAHHLLKQLALRARLARLAYRVQSEFLIRLGVRFVKFLVRFTRFTDPEQDSSEPVRRYPIDSMDSPDFS